MGFGIHKDIWHGLSRNLNLNLTIYTYICVAMLPNMYTDRYLCTRGLGSKPLAGRIIYFANIHTYICL